MPSIGTTLLDSLRSVERPGEFCVGGIREIFVPTIDIDDAGRIAFPILPTPSTSIVGMNISRIPPTQKSPGRSMERRLSSNVVPIDNMMTPGEPDGVQ